MIVEAERQQFRGVVCLHCKAAIPVPSVVGHTGVDRGEEEIPAGTAQVFNVRCPVCHKEKPYRTSEIVNFEGAPDLTVSPIRPGSVRPQGEISKAAKA